MIGMLNKSLVNNIQTKDHLAPGDSPLVKRMGRFPVVSFKIVQHGKELIPWKGLNPTVMEWVRNSSVLLGDIRYEMATFWRVDKNVPVYYQDAMQPDSKMDMAVFTSELDGNEYNVANRLVKERRIKQGDRVKLEIWGCCSIGDAEKVKEEEEETLS